MRVQETMALKEVQYDVDEWVSQFAIGKDGYFSPPEIILQLVEEVGELSREINNRYGPRTKKSPEDTADIRKELCDIMFAIICMANVHNIDLDKAWKEKMDKQYGRDKERFEKR